MTAKETTPADDEKAPTDDIDTERVFEYASELVDPKGPLRGERVNGDRVKDLTYWLGDAAGVPRDVDADTDLELTDEGDPDDTMWVKHAPVSTGRVRTSGLVHHEYSGRDADNPTARVETMPAGDHTVSLSVTFEAVVDDVELTHGAIAEFTPGQAEALAAALVEIAAEARGHDSHA
jgi:hypothetical protein